jgi:hypothetical protein
VAFLGVKNSMTGNAACPTPAVTLANLETTRGDFEQKIANAAIGGPPAGENQRGGLVIRDDNLKNAFPIDKVRDSTQDRPMKLSITPVKLLIPVFVGLFIILVASGCANKGNPTLTTCIQPCATHSEADKEISGKLAAKLEQFKADASAEAKYTNTIKNDFPELSDENARLCLGLRAIECYRKNKVIDKATAQQMAIETLRDYRSRNGVSAVGGKLKPYEKNLIKKSAEGQSIIAELRSYNLAD